MTNNVGLTVSVGETIQRFQLVLSKKSELMTLSIIFTKVQYVNVLN